MIRMPWTNETAPHSVLEITQKCNISCRACYKIMDGSIKPFKYIMDDLDNILQNRHVQTISIAGGEPTLHSDLCKIVAIIHKRGIRVALITNGLLLDEHLYAALKRAGIDVIMFHVDEYQKRPDLSKNPDIGEVNNLRKRLTEQAIEHGIDTGLCVTIYKETLCNVPKLIKFILDSEHINYLFATHCSDIERIVGLANLLKDNMDKTLTSLQIYQGDLSQTTNRDIIKIIENNFQFSPFGYIPSKASEINPDCQLSWITYFVPVIYGKSGHISFSVKSSFVDVLLIKFVKVITGKFIYYCKGNPFLIGSQMVFNAMATRDMLRVVDFLAGLIRKEAHLKAKRLVFENGPKVLNDGQISCCNFCPNATVRNRKMIPICLADYIEPHGRNH